MYWCKLYPKLHIDFTNSPWTLHSGSIYKTLVGSLVVDLTCGLWEGLPSSTFPIQPPTLLNNVDSVANIVAPGDWFYNPDDQYLYVRALSGSPNANGYTLESIILSASHAGHMNLTPGNSGTSEVYWEGNLVEAPKFKQALSDLGLGFIPSASSSLRCLNTDGYFNKYLYGFDFKNAKCSIFQEFKVGNEPLNPTQTLSGIIDRFTVNEKEISFTISSFLNVLDSLYPVEKVINKGFTGLKPDHEQLYIRKLYGRVSGIKPIQLDYSAVPSITTNRGFVVSQDPLSSHPVLNVPINTGGTNTTTETTVTDSTGFAPGDFIVIEQAGVPTYGVFITFINYSTHLITHSFIAGRVVAAGDDVRRGFVSNIKITDTDGSTHFLAYERDWTEDTSLGCARFRLTDNFEANHPTMTTPFNPETMEISCTVYGVKTLPTLYGGGSLGAISKEGGAVANPVMIVYDILSEAFRGFESFGLLPENASFIAETAAAEELVGFSIPETQQADPLSFKEIIINILNSFLGRVSMFDTASGPRFGINRVAPTLSTPDYILDKSEIISFSYDHDYEDAPSRINIFVEPTETNHGPIPAVTVTGGEVDGITSTRFFQRSGKYAIRSYFTSSERNYSTYLWHPSDYTTGAVGDAINHIMYYIWQRSGKLTVTVKNRLIEAEIGNTIQVNRDALPGFEFLYGTERTRKFILIEKQQGIDSVVLVLDDQKGVEDVAGSW